MIEKVRRYIFSLPTNQRLVFIGCLTIFGLSAMQLALTALPGIYLIGGGAPYVLTATLCGSLGLCLMFEQMRKGADNALGCLVLIGIATVMIMRLTAEFAPPVGLPGKALGITGASDNSYFRQDYILYDYNHVEIRAYDIGFIRIILNEEALPE